MNKNEKIIFRLTPELKQFIEEESKKLELSSSAYIRMIIIKHLNVESK